MVKGKHVLHICTCCPTVLLGFYLVCLSWRGFVACSDSGSHSVTLILKDLLKNPRERKVAKNPPKKISPGYICHFRDKELYFSGINREEDRRVLLVTHK